MPYKMTHKDQSGQNKIGQERPLHLYAPCNQRTNKSNNPNKNTVTVKRHDEFPVNKTVVDKRILTYKHKEKAVA